MGADFTVWASAKNAPLAVCDNPQIQGGDYPQGSNRGQFGWDVGIKYSSLKILATSIEQQAATRQAKIRRLAICVHGDPGLVDIDGALPSAALTSLAQRPSEQEIQAKCLTNGNFDRFRGDLARVGSQLSGSATVLFMSCNMGAGQVGSELLKRLSQQPFSGARVVGFIHTGFAPGVIKVGEYCQLPGVKIEDATTTSWSEAEQNSRQTQLLTQPWASESLQTAKIAVNGILTKNPDSSTSEHFRQDILNGAWEFEIGDWKGMIMFQVAGRSVTDNLVPSSGYVYWAVNRAAPRKWGEWRMVGSTLSWEFWDDAPGSKRTFETNVDLDKSQFGVLNGEIKVNNRNSGFFKIVNNR